MGKVVGTVSQLWRYPLKSALGESLQQAAVDASGVAGDRKFALIDLETGLIASAKRPTRWARLLELDAKVDDAGDAIFTFPEGGSCSTADDDVDTRLSTFLGREVKLVTEPPEGASFEEVWDPGKNDSPLYGEPTGSNEGGQAVVALQPSPAAPPGTFFDCSAMHVLTTSSLAALQAAYPEGEVDARRFRPNLVIEVPDDAGGFVENQWTRSKLTIGASGLTLQGMMATMRCVMTTLAQPGLSRDPGILQATNKANRIKVPGMGDYACMGIFCLVTNPGSVQVGDEVTLD